MEDFRSLKYTFLLIAISIQIIGIVLILAFWISTRHKKRRTNGTSQLATAGAKFSSTTETDTIIMTSSQEPNDTILLNLGSHGCIQGRLIRDNAAPLAQYFGGVRYALPPSQRWVMARRLPAEYSYGTKTNPGRCEGRAVTCPQPFMGEQGSEDCFECNVWMPVGECPNGGMFNSYLDVCDIMTDRCFRVAGCILYP
jgi:hypothetical protein